MTPLPTTTCPLCGGPNGCAPAACGRFDVECWCRAVSIDQATLDRIPPAERGRSCLCARCAAATGDQPGACSRPPLMNNT